MATGTGNLPYPMSPVSPFDVITSQAENERIANIESLADGTGIGDSAVTAAKIADGAVTAAKIADSVVKRQNNTTNSYVTAPRIETGWGVFTVNTSTSIYEKTVTFQTAFSTPPIVVVTFGGDSLSATEAYGSGQNTIESGVGVKAHTITTTNFKAYMRKFDNTKYGGSGRAYYQWIAIGA